MDVWATQQSPLAPHMHRLVSQSSLILFGRGVAFGLSGNWDCFEQNHSSRNAWLIIFISTLWPVMHFRVFKTYLKKEKPSIISSSYLMWLSKMFLIISSKDRVRAGAELREKNPGWRLWGIVLLFKNFSLLFFLHGGGGRDHTEGRQGGTTTLDLDWVMQEKIPFRSVPMPERRNNNNNNKKPNPHGIMHRLHYVSQDQPSVRIPAVDIPGLSGCM